MTPNSSRGAFSKPPPQNAPRMRPFAARSRPSPNAPRAGILQRECEPPRPHEFAAFKPSTE